MVINPSAGLKGTITVPADKSISHRALLLGALAQGRVRVSNLLESEDCLATWSALEALGVHIEREGLSAVVTGVGPRGFTAPKQPIDCGNSGTTMRILAGVLAGQDFDSVLVGDESLSARPMRRVAEPLGGMGADIATGEGGRPPLTIRGRRLHGVEHVLEVASAQVKSSLLLAGMLADGTTTVTEPSRSRDHTERMLAYLGVRVDSEGNTHRVEGGQTPVARDITICADLSSAAFFVVAALLAGTSKVLLPRVGVNPTRTGILEILAEMGGNIKREAEGEVSGEPVADLRVTVSTLCGVDVGGEIVPRVIDDIPVLAVAATQASGRTTIRDAAELRVKETDRIAAMASELGKMGARVEERPDGMVVEGPSRLRGAVCDSHGDHRIAMAVAVAGLVAEGETRIRGAECIDVSFPGFGALLKKASGQGE